MNHQISDALMHKASKNDYQTRFLLQSGAAKSKNHDVTHAVTRKPSRTYSKLIQRMGGMSMFDFLVITLSERIAEDPTLEPVYGDLNLKALIQLQKELLLFAFSDDQDAFLFKNDGTRSTTNILYRHCELGLMEDPSHFDSLLTHLLQALRAVSQEKQIVLKSGSRFAKSYLLLEETHAQMMQAKKSQKEPSKRPFFPLFLQRNAKAA
jgi:truncated hemoglobin YjbI